MKTKSVKKGYRWLKIASLSICATMGLGQVVNAQTTTGDIAQQSLVIPGTTTTGGAIKLVDNKGVIKYLQVQNGLTILSNTTNNVTTTTWQLGGTLTSNTSINFGGKTFSFANVLQNSTANGAAVADTIPSTASTIGTSGYTLLVRDESTGNVMKMLATALVQSGSQVFTATAGQTAYTCTGNIPLPVYSQVWVLHNGINLVGNVDYTVSGAIITLIPSTLNNNTNWAVDAGDIIEVKWVK
jgi:hypothetical protein